MRRETRADFKKCFFREASFSFMTKKRKLFLSFSLRLSSLIVDLTPREREEHHDDDDENKQLCSVVFLLREIKLFGGAGSCFRGKMKGNKQGICSPTLSRWRPPLVDRSVG